jgi:DNA primase
LNTAVGKRGYADRLAANLRRLGDPVEQDHYVKLLAEKTGTSEEAVRAKLEGAEKSSQTTSGGNASKPGLPDAQPSRRAVVQAEGKPTARRLLEESLLAIMLMDSTTRLCLEDLEETDFSSDERQAVFLALRDHREQTASTIAKSLTQLSDYINILLLRGEQEFADLAPADRSFEAFGLARRLQMASNKETKQTLSDQLRDAESKGDVQLVASLLKRYQSLLEEEV